MPKNEAEPLRSVEQIFAVLKSVDEFNGIEVQPYVNGLVRPDRRAQCYLGMYLRAVANVSSLLIFENPKHFQAISMIARNMFELAVDIRLLNIIPNAIDKVFSFTEVEKLRCAEKIVKFKEGHPNTSVNVDVYSSYIGEKRDGIKIVKEQLWPNNKQIEHWSGENKLRTRLQHLGEPFREIYEVEYPRLSWYVHAGLVGIFDLKPETFTRLCGVAIHTSIDAYELILLAMIEEFKIEDADSRIKNKLVAAKLAPFAKDEDEANAIYRQLVR